jgi:uncharacterized RDD family membrane protein YckC
MSGPSFSAPSEPGYYLPVPPPPLAYAYQHPYASLPSRLGAIVLDSLLLLAIGALVAIPFGIYALAATHAGVPLWWLSTFLWGPFTLVMFALWIGYFTYFEGTTGQTPGKRALGLRVIVTSTGRSPDLGHAFVRNLLRVVDWLPAFYLLGGFLALVTSQKQRLGDLLAATIVVRA